LPYFNQNLYFLDRFSEKSQISNFNEIRSVAVAPIPADRRTDTTNSIGVFRDYENAPKIHLLSSETLDNNLASHNEPADLRWWWRWTHSSGVWSQDL